MHQGGWPWGPSVLAALGKDGASPSPAKSKDGLKIWHLLDEWQEQPPETPPGNQPVDEAEMLARLDELLGPAAEHRPEQVEYARACTLAFQPPGKAGEPRLVLAEAGTGPEATRINRIFHATLLDAAKNRFLARSMLSLQKALLILGPSQLLDGQRADEAVSEHRDIMAALQARDGAAAEAQMRAHIEAAQRMRIRALRERDRGHDDT